MRKRRRGKNRGSGQGGTGEEDKIEGEESGERMGTGVMSREMK
jgi:hypothetical protein